jgi:hypothetical protein
MRLHLLLVCGLLATVSGGLIIRVRLSSGVMERVDVDAEDCIGDFRNLLCIRGFVNPSSSILFKATNVTELSADVQLKSLGILNGDIFDISDSEPVCANPAGNSNTERRGASTPPRQPKQKSVASIDELKRRRASLVKIVRQKPLQETLVTLPTSTGSHVLHCSLPNLRKLH